MCSSYLPYQWLPLVYQASYKIAQEIDQVKTPEFKWQYVANVQDGANGLTYDVLESYDVNGYFLLEITKQPEHATGYFFNVGGTTYETEKTYYYKIPQSEGSVKLSVYARGGSFDDTYYYLDSKRTTEITVNLLKTPDGITIDEYGTISWNAIPNATRYFITVIYNGTTYDAKEVRSASCYLYDIIGGNSFDPTLLTVEIIAKGNENSVTSAVGRKDW